MLQASEHAVSLSGCLQLPLAEFAACWRKFAAHDASCGRMGIMKLAGGSLSRTARVSLHHIDRFLDMTTIAGKDAALEDTLSRFKKVASELKIDLVEEQWLNPLPDLWSVHLAVANCPAIFSNGKGSTVQT